MQIAVVGSGYVGPAPGACLADAGTDGVCAHAGAGGVERLSRGGLPGYAPGLAPLVERSRRECAAGARVRAHGPQPRGEAARRTAELPAERTLRPWDAARRAGTGFRYVCLAWPAAPEPAAVG